MKKILLFLFLPLFINAQEIALDKNTSLYSFEKIESKIDSISLYKSSFKTNLETLNYTNIYQDEDYISGENSYSILIMGTPLQVKYFVRIDFKEDRYKILITKFIIDDKRWSPVPLENIKAGKNRWIKDINEKLPSIIKSIETSKKDW